MAREGRRPPDALGRIGNSSSNPCRHNIPEVYLCQRLLCANPLQPFTSGQRPLMFSVRRDLMRVTSEECILPTIRNWQPTPLAARRQCPIHTNPRSAAPATSPNFAAPLDAPRRLRRQHPEVAVPMLARRRHRCFNAIQKLGCAQPQFNGSI